MLRKLGRLLILSAAVAGVVAKVKKSKASAPVSNDQWPDVPENPVA